MSVLACYQGLEAAWRGVDGLRGVLLGSPTGDMDLPCLYVAYASFDRTLRNNPPGRNLTGMAHLFVARLVIRWVDFQAAEMQLLTLMDAIPDAIDRDPQLGGRLYGGVARVERAITGFAEIGGVLYRVVDYDVTVAQKREGT